MGHFEIIQRNGNRINLQSREPFCAVKSATQNTSLMGDDNVQITFVSTELYTFGKGDKLMVGSEEYTIRTKVQREMISEGYYQYEATFYGVMYELMKSLYRNAGEDGRSTTSSFDLTYSINDFVKVLIYNVSRDYPGLWVFDEENCPDTEPRTISFSKQNCLQVLQSLCSENGFGLEFQITQEAGVRTIHIGKFGSKVNPPSGSEYFEWGKGNGLYKLKEQKVDDKTIITRLWVEGGSTNIKSGYRDFSERLQLPYPRRANRNEHKLADGTVVKAGSEYIGIDDDSKRYLEDTELRDALGSDEDAVTFDEIYPKRTGEVTAVGADINSFVDGTMDFDLCEKDDNGTKYLIDGVAAKITFISGKLAGQQFELAEKGGYDHATKTFKLIPFTDNRGLTIPTTDTEAFRIAVGDRYKLTDINMPDSYVANAEEELWYAGMDEFTPRTQARAQYELTFDRSYFLANLPSDSEATIFHVGDYLPVKDDRFGIEKTIRIQKVTRNLLAEHDYSLTLSDIVAVSIISQTVVGVKEHEQVIENNKLRDVVKMRRGWRTTEELRNMVYDTDGYFDAENIRPNSIDTNMLTVGSKSQQFVLNDVVLQANVNGLPNRFDASAGTLLHLTIDENAIRQWNMSAVEFTMDSNLGYYLFAKCSKVGNTGIWHLTQEQLKVEPTEDPNNYYFQVGIVGSLNSDDNFRDFTTTYGFTRINGNTITTGRIITADKQSYLDLDGNKFRIGDSTSSIDYNVTKQGQITFRNVKLLSQSGDISSMGVWRGEYNADYIYYIGDEVTYTINGEICTYRYINVSPSKGIDPTNTSYWAVVAKGLPGDTGVSVFYTYHDSIDTPPTPTGDGTSDGWHHDSTDAVVWMSIKQAKSISEGTWGSPIRVRGADGTSIRIKGSLSSASELPTTGNVEGDAYIIEGYLYVWNGISWNNVGQFQGNDGVSSYLHKKYSNDGGKTFTDGNGETPGDWLGLYVDQNPIDSDNPADYTWSHIKGDKGDKGDSPVLVFRGEYSSYNTYYGTAYRLDAVKYNGMYYIASIDAGTFSNEAPETTNKWNTFGAQFESIATNLLLAENANIANLIFRNERLESQSQTNGVPNFSLDGLKNIASFGAGSVVFSGASAMIGWMQVVGRELLGFDDEGIQRLRLTPNSLPSVGSASESKSLRIISIGGDATYTGADDYEVSFSQPVHYYHGREDEDDVQMYLYAYIEVDIADDSTQIDLSAIQFGCAVKRTGSTSYEQLSCSMSAYAKRQVGTSWENVGGVSINDGSTAKITIPKAGRIRIIFSGSVDESIYYDCSGQFTMDARSIQAVTAKSEMIIAKDGFMAIYNSNYMRMHSKDGLIVKFGNYHFRITDTGIAKSTDGILWTNL